MALFADTADRERRGWGRRGRAPTTLAESLAFEDVAHRYGRVVSLRGVSLEVSAGEIVCLLGPSGCGKTTLLRLAAGLEPLAGGRILIGGREMSGPSAMVPPERRGVGLMFQDHALFPHMTILRNVMYGLRALGRADARQVALAALQRVALESHAGDYPHTLSGGEQQRVALARAVAPRPGVLLMDEPFSGLDRRLRDSVREETLAVIRETHATAIVVTHDPEEAMRMADRIALMRAGELVQVGTAEALYARPASLFCARFFTELNEIEGRVRGGVAETPLGRFPVEDAAEGDLVAVCVRPNGVELDPSGHGVQGRVVARRFLGEVVLLEIAVEGLDAPLKARLRASEEAAPGDDVGLTINRRHVLTFPRERA